MLCLLEEIKINSKTGVAKLLMKATKAKMLEKDRILNQKKRSVGGELINILLFGALTETLLNFSPFQLLPSSSFYSSPLFHPSPIASFSFILLSCVDARGEVQSRREGPASLK